jgi:cytochrome c biogenesis protein
MSLGKSIPFGNGKAFTFDRYDSDFSFNGKSVGEAVVGTLTEEGQAPREVVLLTRFSSYDKMRKGSWILSVEGHEHGYYTGLQVTRDPGVGLVYTGFILMIAGCIVAFFMGHKKIRVEVTPSANGSFVTVSGSAQKSKWWMKRYAEQLLNGLV